VRITEELRTFAYEWGGILGHDDGKKELLAIADRIDEEHDRQQEDLIDETLGGLMKMTDEKMAENGWVRLPKDADDVPIHLGDVMDGVDKYDSLKKVMGEVVTISFDATLDPDDSMSVGIRVWSDDRKSYHTAYLDPNASVYHHHHEPTVEELLEEMYDALDDARIPNGSEKRTYEEIIAEYAQKLQLRKETE